MSADNSVVVLITLAPDICGGHEYRVAHVQGIDSIYYTVLYSERDHGYNLVNLDPNNPEDLDYIIEEAREAFRNAEVFTDRQAAFSRAIEIYDEQPFVEYGIQEITIDREF